MIILKQNTNITFIGFSFNFGNENDKKCLRKLVHCSKTKKSTEYLHLGRFEKSIFIAGET